MLRVTDVRKHICNWDTCTCHLKKRV